MVPYESKCMRGASRSCGCEPNTGLVGSRSVYFGELSRGSFWSTPLARWSRKSGGGGRPLASIFEAEGAERGSQGPGWLYGTQIIAVGGPQGLQS